MIVMNVIFLKAALQEKIWGGQTLATQFGFDIPSEQTGEAWTISAHPNGQAIVESPHKVAGMTLGEFYQTHAAYFGPVHLEKFPLLTKILDASDELSVQVHPDDAYGLANEGELGKTECWYILSAEPGAKLQYGHNAQSLEEFVAWSENGEWDKLLRYIEVKAGELYYVPSGTVHALGKGIVVLETQQNSDTTYRLYDYDRLDDQGQGRELHLKQSADVVTIPHVDPVLDIKVIHSPGGSISHLITEGYFSVYKWDVTNDLKIDVRDNYYGVTVIEGSGEMKIGEEVYTLKKGQSFILSFDLAEVSFTGALTMIASQPENNK